MCNPQMRTFLERSVSVDEENGASFCEIFSSGGEENLDDLAEDAAVVFDDFLGEDLLDEAEILDVEERAELFFLFRRAGVSQTLYTQVLHFFKPFLTKKFGCWRTLKVTMERYVMPPPPRDSHPDIPGVRTFALIPQLEKLLASGLSSHIDFSLTNRSPDRSIMRSYLDGHIFMSDPTQAHPFQLHIALMGDETAVFKWSGYSVTAVFVQIRNYRHSAMNTHPANALLVALVENYRESVPNYRRAGLRDILRPLAHELCILAGKRRFDVFSLQASVPILVRLVPSLMDYSFMCLCLNKIHLGDHPCPHCRRLVTGEGFFGPVLPEFDAADAEERCYDEATLRDQLTRLDELDEGSERTLLEKATHFHGSRYVATHSPPSQDHHNSCSSLVIPSEHTELFFATHLYLLHSLFDLLPLRRLFRAWYVSYDLLHVSGLGLCSFVHDHLLEKGTASFAKEVVAAKLDVNGNTLIGALNSIGWTAFHNCGTRFANVCGMGRRTWAVLLPLLLHDVLFPSLEDGDEDTILMDLAKALRDYVRQENRNEINMTLHAEPIQRAGDSLLCLLRRTGIAHRQPKIHSIVHILRHLWMFGPLTTTCSIEKMMAEMHQLCLTGNRQHPLADIESFWRTRFGAQVLFDRAFAGDFGLEQPPTRASYWDTAVTGPTRPVGTDARLRGLGFSAEDPVSKAVHLHARMERLGDAEYFSFKVEEKTRIGICLCAIGTWAIIEPVSLLTDELVDEDGVSAPLTGPNLSSC
ncbi:hypothetical protein PAPYR_12104 [Paratrimastix pyriformis]|uniref:Uncharacterized protein n=1 Tax=Paratrimastix pyriformis TaxID=342808 RepID=A0ABQ8U7W2_9EUKA|nr:hypothetical protein PAPYR_12104 [Paratrimastix pyriformis]